jgi:hypothetical protein
MVISPSRHNVSKHPTSVEEMHHPHCCKNIRLTSFSIYELKYLRSLCNA